MNTATTQMQQCNYYIATGNCYNATALTCNVDTAQEHEAISF